MIKSLTLRGYRAYIKHSSAISYPIIDRLNGYAARHDHHNLATAMFHLRVITKKQADKASKVRTWNDLIDMTVLPSDIQSSLEAYIEACEQIGISGFNSLARRK